MTWRLLRLLLSLTGPRHHGEGVLLLLSRLHSHLLRWRPLSQRKQRGALLRELLSRRHHLAVLLLSRMLLLVHHHLLRPLLAHHHLLLLLLPWLHCHLLWQQRGILRELLLTRPQHHRIWPLLLLLLPGIHHLLLLPSWHRHHPGSRNVHPLSWRLRVLFPHQWPWPLRPRQLLLLLLLVRDLPAWAHHGAPLDLLLLMLLLPRRNSRLLLLLLPWWSPRLLLLIRPPWGPGRRRCRSKGTAHWPHHRAPIAPSRRGAPSLLLPGHAWSRVPGPSLLLLLLLLPSHSLMLRHLLTGRPRPHDVPVPDRARVLAPTGGLPP